MKAATIASVLLVVALAAGWHFIAGPSEGNSSGIAATGRMQSVAADSLVNDHVSQRGSAATRESRGSHAGQTRTVLRSELAGTDTRLWALSIEEARWLEKHGYPTMAELQRLDSYSEDALLEAGRDRKVPKAAVLLGLKRLGADDESGALAAFSVGARNGSLYARQAAALTSLRRAGNYPGGANDDHKAIAIAELEVTRMLGDHRVGGLIDHLGSDLNSRFYGETIRQQMVEFMRQYAADYSSRGLPVPGPDPRPNADLWAKIDAGTDPNEVITIVDRGGG